MKIIVTVKNTDNIIGLKEAIAMRLEGLADVVRIDVADGNDVAPKSEVENYKQVAEYQQSLSVKRYHEIKRLQEEIETLKDNNEHLAVMLEEAKQEADELAEEHSDLIVEKDQLFDIAEKQKLEIESLKIANEKMYSAIEATKAEVIEEYRQRVNAKMGKHTHLLGKEYVQRILREATKEMVGVKDV